GRAPGRPRVGPRRPVRGRRPRRQRPRAPAGPRGGSGGTPWSPTARAAGPARRSGRAPVGRSRVRGAGLSGRGTLARGLRVDARLLALLRRDRCGRTRERVVAAARLGEGDGLADRLRARKERDDPIPAERDPAMRGRTVLERVEQEPEPLLRLLRTDAHDAEDPLLDVAAVDTDRPTTDLVAVAHDVVRVRERLARRLLEAVDPLGRRRGEGVVDRGPRAL